MLARCQREIFLTRIHLQLKTRNGEEEQRKQELQSIIRILELPGGPHLSKLERGSSALEAARNSEIEDRG